MFNTSKMFLNDLVTVLDTVLENYENVVAVLQEESNNNHIDIEKTFEVDVKKVDEYIKALQYSINKED